MEEPFLVRLPRDQDLLTSITRAFQERSIKKAGFTVIGAVTKAALAYYDLASRQYGRREFPGAHELVSCTGNVSEKDGETFVHAHVVLGDKDFKCVGGHLAEGTTILVAELYGTPLSGEIPVRKFDEATGLALWPEG